MRSNPISPPPAIIEEDPMLRLLATASAVILLAAAPALAQDAKKGENIFKRCAACHNATTDKNKIGPTLKGVVGRKAGSIEGFKYSKAMQQKAEEGLVWTKENLDAYLENPKKVVPRGSMSFAGLRKADERADVITYLESVASK
jgi:cytochrome c